MTVVLGLDPGTVTTGWGVVMRDGSRLRHVDNGLIVGRSGAPLEDRLARIFEGIEAVIATHKPIVVAVEAVFSHKNAQSALVLGHARGVALLAAARRGLPVASYAPALVKKSVSGHGRAEKFQIQMMVKAMLGLPEPPAEDAADALALCICHCHHQNGVSLDDRALTRPRR